MALRYADIVKGKVEELLIAKVTGTSMSRELADWLADIGEGIYDKLAAKRLVDPKKPNALAVTEDAPVLPLLGEFMDQFLATRNDLKRNTPDNLHPDSQGHAPVFWRRPPAQPNHRR